jgi:hypothetical protein
MDRTGAVKAGTTGEPLPTTFSRTRSPVSICFTPHIHDPASDLWLRPPAARADPESFELSLSNGNGIAILLALGLAPDPVGEPCPIDRFASLVTAALRQRLARRSPERAAWMDAPDGQLTIIHCGRREGHIGDCLGELARLVQRSRAIGATHGGWG